MKMINMGSLKRLTQLVLGLCVCAIFVSCNNKDDYYSLGDIWISLGIIDRPNNGSDYTIIIDNGDTLVPVSYDTHYFSFCDSQRVMANYTILDEVGLSTNKFWVKINNLYDVLYKDIVELTELNADSIGDDPVHIDEIWISKNFLNIEFIYLGGENTHYINLTHKEGNISNPSQPIELELRHNAKNDPTKYNLRGFVTFDLQKLKISDQDSVSFKVKSTDYNGEEHTFSGTYHY